MIPEIIGRLPVLTYMNPLDESTLRMILTEPKNAIIKQYIKLFGMDDIALSFEEEALNFIVEKALEYKLGARGLRSLCESILTDAIVPTTRNRGKIIGCYSCLCTGETHQIGIYPTPAYCIDQVKQI